MQTTYQISRPIAGKLYVCDTGGPPIARRVAGPFNSQNEAIAASGAIEIEQPCLQARTEIWVCPPFESDCLAAPIAIPSSHIAIGQALAPQ